MQYFRKARAVTFDYKTCHLFLNTGDYYEHPSIPRCCADPISISAWR